MLRQQEPDMISYPEIEIQMDIGFLLVASFHPSMCCISVVYFSLDSHAGNVQWSMLNCIDWKGKRKTIVWAQFTGSTRTSAWASDMYYMEKYVCLGVGCRINFVHTQGTYIQYRRCSFPGSPASGGRLPAEELSCGVAAAFLWVSPAYCCILCFEGDAVQSKRRTQRCTASM